MIKILLKSVGLLRIHIKTQFVCDAIIWLSIWKAVSYSSMCGPFVSNKATALPSPLSYERLNSLTSL